MLSTVPQLTDAGRALLMRSTFGEQVQFTRMALGDGQLGSLDPDTLTALVHEKLSVPITGGQALDGAYQLTGIFSSADVAADFVCREFGLFAKGEDNVTVLYAYANDGANSGTVRALDDAYYASQQIRLVVDCDMAENFSVDFTPNLYAYPGTYTGSGAQGRTIDIGFTPSAVSLCDEFGRTWNDSKGVCGGIATALRGVRIPSSSSADDATTWNNSATALMIVTDGFKVNYLSGGSAAASVDTNESGVVYHYIAYR